MSDDSVCCLVDCVVGVVGKGEVVFVPGVWWCGLG